MSSKSLKPSTRIERFKYNKFPNILTKRCHTSCGRVFHKSISDAKASIKNFKNSGTFDQTRGDLEPYYCNTCLGYHTRLKKNYNI